MILYSLPKGLIESVFFIITLLFLENKCMFQKNYTLTYVIIKEIKKETRYVRTKKDM